MNLIKRNIIYRYGVPYDPITNIGKQFYNKLMNKLCNDFGFHV